MASSPLNPRLLFAANRGIFRSHDGFLWVKLAQFGDHNYPIAISDNGHVFIGDQKSIDEGRNFSGFIQWDQLLNAAHLESHKIYWHNVRIVRIGFPEGSDHIVQLTLGNTHYQWQFEGVLEGAYRWRLESSRKL